MKKILAVLLSCALVLALSAPALAEEAAVKSGSVVTFGRYPQTAEGDDETPIKWIVLTTDEKSVLMISIYALDCQPWASQDDVYNVLFGGTVEWKTCALRKWLNTTFLDKAFTKEEKDVLLSMTLKNAGGEDSTDGVTLLTGENVTSIFRELRCEPTAYVKAKYNIEEDYCGWWTRTFSTGFVSGAMSVSSEGKYGQGDFVDQKGVRPVVAVTPDWFTASHE